MMSNYAKINIKIPKSKKNTEKLIKVQKST